MLSSKGHLEAFEVRREPPIFNFIKKKTKIIFDEGSGSFNSRGSSSWDCGCILPQEVINLPLTYKKIHG